MKDITSILADFRLFLQSQRAAPHSIRAYLGDLKAFASWFEATTNETFDPASTVRRDLLDWRDELAKTCKPATINRKLSSLRIFFDWAGRQGLSSTDPTTRVHGLRPVFQEPETLDETAVEKILHAARPRGSARDRAMLELLAAAGLRVSELVALRRRDLELGEASAWLNVSAARGRPKRRIPINVRARVALKEYLAECGETRQDEPIFLSRLGKALTAYAIWYAVKKYASDAGMEHISPRSFRNAITARLVRDPAIGLVAAAAFLGQNRLDVLARHVQPGNLERIAE